MPDGSTLLFLPLAHAFARIIQVGCLESGVTLGHSANISNLVPELQRSGPRSCSPCRGCSRRSTTARSSRPPQSPAKSLIFAPRPRRRSPTARRSTPGRRQRPGAGLTLRHAVSTGWCTGSCARRRRPGQYAVSGGAALGERLGHFFRGVGITILEGYGMTETDRGRDGQPAEPEQDRDGRAAGARRQHQDRRRRRDPGQGADGLPRLLAQRRGDHGRTGRRGLAPHRRHRLARRRGLPADHRPEEGADRHGRREERRAQRARGPAAREPADQSVHGGRRQPAVYRLPDDPRRGDPRYWKQAARQAGRRHAADLQTIPTCSPTCSRRSTTPTRRSPGPSRSSGSGCWTPTSPSSGQLTPSLKLRRSVVAKDFAADIEALYS